MEIKYISIKKLIKDTYPTTYINSLLNDVLKMTLPTKKDYPEYEFWFWNKQVTGIYDGNRDIVLALSNNQIVGISSIKKENNEDKICTLYIKNNFRKNQIGNNLVEKSIELLDNSRPLLTMPINKLNQYKKLIKKYNWILTDSIDDCYNKNTTELIFNGELKERNYESNKILLKSNNNLFKIILKFKYYYLFK